ncbi:MAG: tetratricopeptide repeat protein [Gallionella sp.]
MNNSFSRWAKLFRESFVPVVIVILSIFLILLYVEFRAKYDADKVTVIDIQALSASTYENEGYVIQSDSEPIVSSGADAEQMRAATLLAKGSWPEAERIYLDILAKQPSSRAFNDLGVLYMKKGDLPRALGYLNQAVEVKPVDTSALFNRALAFSRSGRNREAIEGYRALLAQQPSHFDGQYNLALLLIKQGDNAAGVKALEAAAEMTGGERKARALYSLGLARRSMNQLVEAASAFEAAIRLRPADPAPRVALATLEPDTEEGRALALIQYRKILELSPSYSPALVNMASVLNAQHKKRDAEQALRQAIQFEPGYVRAHINLGLLLLLDKRWSDARIEFEWILQHEPTRAEANFNLGRVAYGEKDYSKAITEYQTAIKKAAGSYPEALLNLGLSHAAKNDFPAAIAAYEAALKARHQYPEAWYNIGITYLRQKMNQRAEDAFKAAVRLHPDYEQAWFNLGIIYAATDRDKEAMDAYRKALSIRPDYHQAQLNLAVRHAKRKEYAEAIRLYRSILTRDETYSLAWFNLGNAYIGNSQASEAVSAFRKAVDLDPTNTKTLRFLGRALLFDQKADQAVQVLEDAVAADPADARLRLELARALRQQGRMNDSLAELTKARQLDSKLRGIDEEIQKFEAP